MQRQSLKMRNDYSEPNKKISREMIVISSAEFIDVKSSRIKAQIIMKCVRQISVHGRSTLIWEIRCRERIGKKL